MKFSIFFSVFLLNTPQGALAQNNTYLGSKTDTVDCKYVSRIIESNGKSETLYETNCIPRNAKIFVEGKNYIYSVKIYRDIANPLHESKIELKGSNSRWIEQAKAQMAVDFIYEKTENDDLFLRSLTWNSSYTNWQDSIKTGVIENVERVWMHPFRENLFVATKTAAYPDVRFPIEKGNEYQNETKIGKGNGEWSNKNVTSEYKVEGQKTIQIGAKSFLCWEVSTTCKIEANAETQNKMTFLFNEEHGFVAMNYSFANGVHIDFDIIKVIFE